MKLVQSLFVFLFLGLSQATAETKPNVLFLAVDDMNDWIGCLACISYADAMMGRILDTLEARLGTL